MFFIKLKFFALLGLAFAAALSVPGSSHSSELSLFCAQGDILAVKDMLNGGADPNVTDEGGNTPLMSTVAAGISEPLSSHFKIIELLCQAGADVNVNIKGVTPLHLAVAKGSKFLELSLLLLEKGANPNAYCELGTPLHIAARSDAHHDIVRLLLREGADVNTEDQAGAEPLVWALTALNPSFEKIELLLDAGADVNATFNWGTRSRASALMAAAVNASPKIVRLLLDRGAWHSFEDDDGLTAYDYAVQAEQEANAELLR